MEDILETALVDLAATKGGPNWRGMNARQIKAYLSELAKFPEAEVLAMLERCKRTDGPMPDLSAMLRMIPAARQGVELGLDLSQCCCWDIDGTCLGNPAKLAPIAGEVAEYVAKSVPSMDAKQFAFLRSIGADPYEVQRKVNAERDSSHMSETEPQEASRA